MHKDSRPPDELMWKCIGFIIYTRAFLGASRFITTTRKGPCMSDVHVRTILDATNGQSIDTCIVEDTPDDVLFRPLP